MSRRGRPIANKAATTFNNSAPQAQVCDFGKALGAAFSHGKWNVAKYGRHLTAFSLKVRVQSL